MTVELDDLSWFWSQVYGLKESCIMCMSKSNTQESSSKLSIVLEMLLVALP